MTNHKTVPPTTLGPELETRYVRSAMPYIAAHAKNCLELSQGLACFNDPTKRAEGILQDSARQVLPRSPFVGSILNS